MALASRTYRLGVVSLTAVTLMAAAAREVAAARIVAGPPLVHEAQLLAPRDYDASGAQLGCAVSVFGDTAVVGSAFDDTAAGVDAGAAYVFVRSGTTWTEQQKLTPRTEPRAIFRHLRWLSGDTAVVGAAWTDTPAGAGAGSAYVFVRSGTTWSLQQKLAASDGATGATRSARRFGLRRTR